MGIQKDIDIRQAALPAGVDPAAARLPEAYESAKRALAECERFFTAFDLMARPKNADEALLELAMMDTTGEA